VSGVWNQQGHPKCWYYTISLHSIITTQKTMILKLSFGFIRGSVIYLDCNIGQMMTGSEYLEIVEIFSFPLTLFFFVNKK
jgi:hypothetical protein